MVNYFNKERKKKEIAGRVHVFNDSTINSIGIQRVRCKTNNALQRRRRKICFARTSRGAGVDESSLPVGCSYVSLVPTACALVFEVI